MTVFGTLIALHIVTGTVGLLAFWVPIGTVKGSAQHRRWGKIGCYGFIGAGVLAIVMAVLSLTVYPDRVPSITDREAFKGLLGWMMIYLGLLTIGFADYGLAVVKHARDHTKLRAVRYQIVIFAVIASALWCIYYGAQIGEMTMIMVSLFGLAAMSIQQYFIWRQDVPPRAYFGEHFRALIGMGISAYTAFLSVGLVHYFPKLVFNPLLWAGPSVIGVSLIIYFTHQGKKKASAPIKTEIKSSV